MEHKGFSIRVEGNGMFTADLGDDTTVSAETLAACRSAIDDELKAKLSTQKIALKVVGVATGGYKTKQKDRVPRRFQCTLIGLNRTTGELKFDTLPVNYDMDEVLPDTPENVALIDQYIKAEAIRDEIYSKIEAMEIRKPGYGGRISAGKYIDKVEEVKKSYAKAFKVSVAIKQNS